MQWLFTRGEAPECGHDAPFQNEPDDACRAGPCRYSHADFLCSQVGDIGKGPVDRDAREQQREMTTRDIELHLKEMYGVQVSPTLISEVTDHVMEQARGSRGPWSRSTPSRFWTHYS
jgi:hypothetical protein